MTLILTLLVTLAQDQDRIQDLIRKLGSEDYATREQASLELQKIGKPARPALEKAAETSEDPEVRQRAQSLLDEKPAPRKTAPVPPPAQDRQGFRGSAVSVSTINGNSTYAIRPFDDTPPLTFHKSAAGSVKLDYTNDQGEAKSAEAPTLAAFLADHAELAQKFGISENGIDYAGSRVLFNGRARPDFAFPPFNGPLPPRRVPNPPAPRTEEGAPIAGALLDAVDDATRSQLDIPDGQGAVILKVVPGGVADALGLKKSDILLEIDGRKIDSPQSVKGLMTRESKVTLLRKGRQETLGGRKDF
ncbi:MAG TPA: HEAT repeat domain-containing protein [Planctomycetota bacterium]|nr:HEAT repeat domain-containing protein [Planctomycetota bacterium]